MENKKQALKDIINEELKNEGANLYKQLMEIRPNYKKYFTEDLIYNINKCLMFSIQYNNIFEYMIFFDEKTKEDTLENLFQNMINIKKEGFFSKNLFVRTKNKYEYYERVLNFRIKIQTIDWNYRHLAGDVNVFLQTREIIKLMYNKMKTMDHYKKDYLSCPVCSTKWLTSEKEDCIRCKEDERRTMFLRLCNVFKVLGDMEKFYNNLDKKTLAVLEDNWEEIKQYFKDIEIKRNNNIILRMKKTYGLPQYNEIIKKDGGDWRIEDDIKIFNKKYNLAVVTGTLKIDLKNATNATTQNFINDLNSIKFNFCEEFLLARKKIKLNDFKPQMRCLKYIDATGCNIKTIKLDNKYFPSLEVIILDENPIENYEDIISLTLIQSLKEISVERTIMEGNRNVYEIEKELKIFKIKLTYSSYMIGRVPKSYIKEAEGEEDKQLQLLMRKRLAFDDSPIPKSDSEDSL